MTDSSVRLLRAEPQLFVTDMARAVAYYTGPLGFRTVFLYGSPPFYGQVARGEAHLNLRRVRTPPVDPPLARKEDLLAAAIVVSDADALHAELAAAGAVVHQAPRTEPWGARTFITVDPDGNLVLFASEAMA